MRGGGVAGTVMIE